VCLISSNNLNLFPRNSRTRFTNRFSSTIKNQNQDELLFVRLRAVGLAIDLQQPEQPGYVKVQLWQVGEQLEGHGFNRLLGGFEHPAEEAHIRRGEQHFGYTYKTFAYTPFLPLRYKSLDQFQILLTDVKNKRIRIEQGPPTVVLLEIQSESEMSDRGSFSITCHSSKLDTYPSNNLSAFTSPLPEMFDLKKYEVALLSVVYPNDMGENCTAIIHVENEEYVINLQDVPNVYSLAYEVNTAMAKGDLGRELEFEVIRTADGEQRMTLTRRLLPHAEHLQQKKFLHVTLSWTFLKVLGDAQSSNRLLMLVPGEKITFSQTPCLDNVWPNPVAMLMCDVIKPGWVGDHMKQLLTCVPVKHKSFETEQQQLRTMAKLHEPAHLHYVDVKETPFNSISFQFVNPGDGMHQREFTLDPASSECITISLSFRPKSH